MPNSSATTSPSKLYIPGSVTPPAPSASDESALHTYFAGTLDSVADYARREPWTFAACVFGVGFVLGWRLKPW